jgi:hypothetical protein
MFISLFININRKYCTGYINIDPDYEEYFWEFDKIEGSLQIQFKTANQRAFPYDNQKEIEQARTIKRNEMLAKLEKELVNKFRLRKNYHFKINREDKDYFLSYDMPNTNEYTITITARGIKEICYRAIQATQLSVKDLPAEILPTIDAPASQVINLKSVNIPEVTLDYYQALLYLDQYIFSQPKRLHSEKSDIIKFIEALFLKVKNTDDLCKLYNYISLKNNKEKINIPYHNFSDTILFWKSNTNSWQTMVANLRKHAYATLIAEVNNKEIVEKEVPHVNISPEPIENSNLLPQDQLAYLRKYHKQKLFTEHRTNNPLSFIYNTKTSQDINRNIDLLEEKSDQVIFETTAIAIR